MKVCAAYQADTVAATRKAQAQIKQRIEDLQRGRLRAGPRPRLAHELPLYSDHVVHRIQKGDPITPTQYHKYLDLFQDKQADMDRVFKYLRYKYAVADRDHSTMRRILERGSPTIPLILRNA